MAKLYLYPLSIVAAAMWLVHSLFAIMNLTTFECGKGPRHVDYLRGTNTMDLVFSKVRTMMRYCDIYICVYIYILFSHIMFTV
jgi:hypothetical protein